MTFSFGEQESKGNDEVSYSGLKEAVSSLETEQKESSGHTCDECGEEIEHIETHIEKSPECEPRQCPVRDCHAWVSGKQSLYEHKKYEHPYNEGILTCGDCGNEVDTTKRPKIEWKQHEPGCEFRKKSMCFYCGGSLDVINYMYDEHEDDCITARAYASERGIDISEGHFVYTLRLESGSGEVYYYVGETNDPHSRIGDHIRGTEQVNHMEVKTIVSIEERENREDALDRERERAFEVARLFGTDNVLGGK